MPSRRNSVGIWISAISITIGAVFAATTYIFIPRVELGSGVAALPACLSGSIVDFSPNTNGTLSRLRVAGIGPDCAAQWVRISLFSSTDGMGVPIEQVVWQIPEASTPPVSSYTVTANGTTTGVISGVIWPSSEALTAGILSGPSAIQVSGVNSFLLETSDTSLTDSY